MKQFLLICSALLLYVNTGITQDAHWPLDIYTDDMAGDNDGVPVGGVNFVQDAARGQVMLLDGMDDYVELPPGLLENVTDITITCWFNWAGGANWQRIYSFGYSNTVGSTAPSVVSTLYLCPKDGWDGNNLHLTLGGPYGQWRDYTPQPIDSNKWYFSAFIKKSDSIIFYLDDQIIVTDTFFMTPADLSPDSMNWIGKSHWPDPTFNGMIDEMRLYKSALTHSEVLELYTPVSGINVISNYAEPLIYTINGKIFIEINGLVNEKNSYVEILNILGKLVYKTNNISSLRDVEFENGIYLIKLVYNNKEYIKKLLIKH
jgi:hypothetical protein